MRAATLVSAMARTPSRDEQINIRVTDDELEKFRALATDAGLSLAAWCRIQLRRAAGLPTA